MRGALLFLEPAAVCGLTAFLLSTTAPIGQAADVTRLNSTEAIERTIGNGEEHRFAIILAAGEYASITVEQRGIDIEASVRNTDGTQIADFQDEVRPVGEERIELVAAAAGTYGLVVKSASGSRASGAYLIRMAPCRPATIQAVTSS